MSGNTAEDLDKKNGDDTRRRSVRLDKTTTEEIGAMSLGPLEVADSAEAVETSGSTERSGAGSPERTDRLHAHAPLCQSSAHKGPIGLDIGTTSIVAAGTDGSGVQTNRRMNAFYPVDASGMVRKALEKDSVDYFAGNDTLYVLGDAAENFATMHGSCIRRPVARGILNPQEPVSVHILKALLDATVVKAQAENETICFSMPAEPCDGTVSTVFHESVIKMHLRDLGYHPVPVHEGLAVVLAELENRNFTGIGISIGGGMCNVCLAYLAVPVVSFGLQKGGDYIDHMVSQAVGEPVSRVRAYKENGLQLSRTGGKTVETALQVYYADVFSDLLKSLCRVLKASDNIPRISGGMPVVLSGGSVSPDGCLELFNKTLQEHPLPVDISEVRVAEQPLYSTARGLLHMAQEEGVSQQ